MKKGFALICCLLLCFGQALASAEQGLQDSAAASANSLQESGAVAGNGLQESAAAGASTLQESGVAATRNTQESGAAAASSPQESGTAAANGLQEFGTVDANGLYKLTGTLPEGYEASIEIAEAGLLHGVLQHPDSTKPVIAFTIVFEETYAEVERMNDLSQEDLDFLISTFESPEKVTYTETAYGTKLMCVSTQLENWDYLTILTIYKGYMIELNMFAGPGTDGQLTDEQEKIAIDFLSDMNFEAMTEIPAENVAP